MTTVRTALVLGALAVAGVVIMTVTSDHGARSAITDRVGGWSEPSGARPGPEANDDGGVGPATRAEARVDAEAADDATWLAELRSRIPKVPSDELTIKRIAKGKETPWEIGQLFGDFNFAYMDEPPFVVGWMFGLKDVPWLTQLRDRLRQAYANAIRELAPADCEGHERALAELLPSYQRVLLDVARARWDEDPEMGAFLADPRLLRDIPLDTDQNVDQSRWLRGVLDSLAPFSLWMGQEWARGRDFPLEYLAATDLPRLVRLRQEALAAIANARGEQTTEEIAKLVRPQAEAFYYGIIEPRLRE